MLLDSGIKEVFVGAIQEAKASSQSVPDQVRRMISEEIRRFGGNTLMNFFRGGRGVSYKEVLCDVAAHTDAHYSRSNSCSEIEQAILLRFLEKSLKSMSQSDVEKILRELNVDSVAGIPGPAAIAALQVAIRSSGFAAYKLAAIIAQSTAKALLGRGLAFTTTAPLMRGISVFAGPIGWAITGIWTAFDLASPAYRVTVPCIVQIAYIRQKTALERMEAQAYSGTTVDEGSVSLYLCKACGAEVSAKAKFCSECGSPTAPLLIN